ncbi:hypothetical protein HGA34_01460 [Candidatus Falkowbacteria bacterium]|nr:hypothetical protein [Candidatus Falkowbacteria bacterium]
MIFKPTSKQLFLASILLQLFFLLFLVISNQLIMVSGKEVFLRTAPVDPRSLFQGDYVILSYAINRISLSDVSVSKEDSAGLAQGATVYVGLATEPGQKYSHATTVTLDRPSQGDFIRGKVQYVDYYQGKVDCLPGSDCILKQESKPTSIRVAYGIESYFVPEGKGRELERVNRRGASPMLVGVSVGSNGQGLIKSLSIDETVIDATDINRVVDTASSTVNAYDDVREREMADSELSSLMRDLSSALQEYRNKNYVYPAKIQGVLPYDELAKLATDSDSRFRYLKVRADNSKINLVWLDNSAYADGYCIAAQSIGNPSIWYYIDSNNAIADAPRELARQPMTLADCGVVVKQPLATIEGYIFIDNNGNKLFDEGDKPFIDADISLNKLFDDRNGWERVIKPGVDGKFKFSVYDEGTFGLGAHANLATPVTINYSKSNSIVVKQGDTSAYNNILVSF